MKKIVKFIKAFIQDVREDRDGMRQAIKISFITGATTGFITGFVGYIIRQYLTN